ncbi:formate dehydrogenase accessory sulfurtransferase FdhD [Candidatus Acetothermia bacterium]|nr:formate dehydrogenase accessory sulfurtransferase FdhD [Candidatus Acetothermia bacterium]
MRQIEITRRQDGVMRKLEDLVAAEGLLTVEYTAGGGFSAAVTPEQVKPFVFGHLLAEGIISCTEEILEYRQWPESGGRIRAVIRLAEEISLPRATHIGTECGPVGKLTERLSVTPLEPFPLITAHDLLQIPRVINDQMEGFRTTGAYHYAFLLTADQKIVAHAEDIGRHNAVDKVIGEVFIAARPFTELILFTTGRVTIDLVGKCLRCRIPLLVSRSAALYGAVTLARQYHLGLVGFLRGSRFNIYSGEEWIIT